MLFEKSKDLEDMKNLLGLAQTGFCGIVRKRKGKRAIKKTKFKFWDSKIEIWGIRYS